MCNGPPAELHTSRVLDTRPAPDYTLLLSAVDQLQKYAQGTADVKTENRRVYDGEK